jgi:phosphatidylglycerophosphatase A
MTSVPPPPVAIAADGPPTGAANGAPGIVGPTDRVAFVLATWFGFGLSKIAPGTCGALGAVPLHYLLVGLPIGLHVLVIVLITAIGTWAAHRVAMALRMEDPQLVVIDEVAGVLIAMAAVRDFGTVAAVTAFLLFRFFDITKPGPIRRAEHLPPAGFGIMADDLLAGVAAAVVARVGVRVFLGV